MSINHFRFSRFFWIDLTREKGGMIGKIVIIKKAKVYNEESSSNFSKLVEK